MSGEYRGGGRPESDPNDWRTYLPSELLSQSQPASRQSPDVEVSPGAIPAQYPLGDADVVTADSPVVPAEPAERTRWQDYRALGGAALRLGNVVLECAGILAGTAWLVEITIDEVAGGMKYPVSADTLMKLTAWSLLVNRFIDTLMNRKENDW